MIDAPSRRADTRLKIVDVASRLLHESGPDAVTTRRVAEAAGLQAPAIYRLFGDKEGLLEAVAEYVLDAYVKTKASRVQKAVTSNVDPLADLHYGWNLQVEFGLTNPSLFRLLSDPGRMQHSSAAQSGKRVLEARIHRVAQTGRLRVSEPRAVDMIQAAGVGVVTTLLSTPPELRDPSLCDVMFEAVLNRMLTDSSDAEERTTVVSAIALRAVAGGLDVLSDAERHLLGEWLDRVIET